LHFLPNSAISKKKSRAKREYENFNGCQGQRKEKNITRTEKKEGKGKKDAYIYEYVHISRMHVIRVHSDSFDYFNKNFQEAAATRFSLA
jgi:hypothetical protein